MWGIVPAAGHGTRIQPLGFSKELLPVGARPDGATERPCAVAEYLLERMVLAGATKICFVISPGKSDILDYFGATYQGADLVYVVQPTPTGLCDALFRAKAVVPHDEPVLIGLPDTIWFPADALRELPDDVFSFLLFPVDHPELFDAVVTDDAGRVRAIEVKRSGAQTNWIWGAFKVPGHTFHELAALWRARGGCDEYVGSLVNAWLGEGGDAWGVRAGRSYVDVGTLQGFRGAIHMLGDGAHPDTGLRPRSTAAAPAHAPVGAA